MFQHIILCKWTAGKKTEFLIVYEAKNLLKSLCKVVKKIAKPTTGHQVVRSWEHGYILKKIGRWAKADSETIQIYTMNFQKASSFY